ncbi:MAG TPA: hypothetical protein VEH83_02605 [Gemmatimonadales bacterium]|nr:hypothetical protein [Gemmatimonadales bacterium]
MIIAVPTGSRFTATLKVKALIPVRCEHCGATFAYRTQQQVSGQARSALWLNQEGAKAKARERAAEAMEAALRRTAKPVPCPQCANYQATMVRKLRGRRKTLGWGIGITAAIVWLIWTLVVWSNITGGFWLAGLSWPQALAALVAIGSVAGGYFWASTLDPVEHARKRAAKSGECASLKPEEYEAIAKVGYLLVKE